MSATIVKTGSGTGKSVMLTIMALYYLRKGIKVDIIVPNQALKEQFEADLYERCGVEAEEIKVWHSDEKDIQIRDNSAVLIDESDQVLDFKKLEIDSYLKVKGIQTLARKPDIRLITLTATVSDKSFHTHQIMLATENVLEFKSFVEM